MDINQIKETVVTLAMGWGLRLAGVLVAILGALVIGGWVRTSMLRAFDKAKFDPTLSRFFSNIARYAILTGAGLGCLGVFGIETASFAAVIAAGGLAVGLAFQGTLSNFAAGVMLLVFRPFRVGDVVTAAGITGSVLEIELFTTRITTPDNRLLIVPNSAVFGGTIENVTHFPTRRVDITLGTGAGADLDKTRQAFVEAIAQVPEILAEPASQVFLSSFAGPLVEWKLRVWVKTPDYWTVHEKLVAAAKRAIDGAGLGAAMPAMRVVLDPPAK